MDMICDSAIKSELLKKCLHGKVQLIKVHIVYWLVCASAYEKENGIFKSGIHIDVI